MNKARILTLFSSLLLTLQWGQAQECQPLSLLSKIKNEAFDHSRMEEYAYTFTDLYGPRLTGSNQWLRAQDSVVTLFQSLDLAHIEIDTVADLKYPGWDYTRSYSAMTSPYYSNYTCVPAPWCGSTEGEIKGEVYYLDIETKEDLKKHEGKLAGRIVLLPSFTRYQDKHFNKEKLRFSDEALEEYGQDPKISGNFDPFTTSYTRRAFKDDSLSYPLIRKFIQEQKPAALLYDNGYYNVIRSQSSWFWQQVDDCKAELAITKEDHARMVRLITHGVPVQVEMEVKAKRNNNTKLTNIYAEIPGTDKKLRKEIVLLGAHLDSWHGGTGANDNGSGCAIMVEAMRIIKSLDFTPKRSIRIALWNGEEQGLLGSVGYCVSDSLNLKNIALYLNCDNGSGRYRGICLEGNDQAEPFFERWGAPLKSLGFKTISLHKSYGTDHMAFVSRGVPGFQFIQDEMGYEISYHTNMDVYERLALNDMKVNAAITAWLAICAANDPQRIPFQTTKQ